jgi:C_GCAxxG_C_C family probable redox protein
MEYGVDRMTDKALSEAEKTELLDRVEERAAYYMNRYRGCGQCALRALQEELNLGGGPAVLKAAGFTNLGIALTQTICGAVLGGIMAMGLACGREDFADSIYPEPLILDEEYQLPKSLMLIRSFYQRFIQEFGSTSCRELQIRIFGRNFETLIMEEEEKFHLAGGHVACVGLVSKSARLAAEIILQLPRR